MSGRAVDRMRSGGPATAATSLIVALLVVLSPAAFAQAQAVTATTASSVEARGIDRVCPPPQAAVDSATQPDLDDLGTSHAQAIDCAVAYGIVSGYGDGTYRPGTSISRAQTATAVAGWLETATGFDLEVPDDSPFGDVDGIHADAIAALAEIGVISGRADGTFRPADPLTRGQFARVVANAISYADVFAVDGPLPAQPGEGSVEFSDVDGTTFETDILALAAAGITTGTAPGVFSPKQAVTRGQLATFLMRSADYLDRHQRWRPTARPVVLVAELHGSTGADGTSPPGVMVSLLINAFNGTVAFVADVSNVPAMTDPNGGLDVLLGTPADPGPLAVRLADADQLQAATRGMITGTVVEADSAVRLADLIASSQQAHVELRAAELPEGVLRGALAHAN